jgi:hypothetical protein
MLENEDSVVTSLNELRKLKHERITRQTHSRAVVGSGRSAALAVDPATDQMTPPPVMASFLAPAQRAPFQSVPAAGPNFGGLATNAGGFAAPSPYDMARMQAPIVQTKTSVKAAVFVAVVLIGAGGAGYVKLQNDTQALLVAKESSIKRAEEARNQAVETAAKADVLARNNLRQCEDRLKAAAAAAAVAPATSTTSAPVVEKKAEKPAPAKVAAHAASRRPAAHPARRTSQAEPAATKSADVPNIAKKKKLDNDPLAGLGKL